MELGEVTGTQIDALATAVEGAQSILFVTGAGLSADSGLPTYRGVGGLYERGMTDEGIPIEVALSGGMLQAEPAVCWKYIAEIERACRGAQPNAAHHVIAELETQCPRVWVLTQNVDGFHRAAGSSQLIEIHGDIATLVCTACRWSTRVADYAHLQGELGTPQEPRAPRCPDCQSVIRPAVVLFGEMLPSRGTGLLESELARGFDVVVSVGTTSGFGYIAAPVVDAKRRGATTVEINPGDTEVSELVDLKIRARAKPTFERLRARLRGRAR